MSSLTGVRGLTDRFCNHVEAGKGELQEEGRLPSACRVVDVVSWELNKVDPQEFLSVKVDRVCARKDAFLFWDSSC